MLADLGLQLHPKKTKVVDLTDGREGLDFLGCHFHARVAGRLLERGIRRYYLQRWPSQAAMKRLRQRIRALTGRGRAGMDIREVISRINPLRFIRAGIPALERGRGDIVYRQIHESFPSFAGRAIEPLARDAIQRMLPDERFGAGEFVGAFWNRENSVEVDLVGGRGQTTSREIDFAGSINWRIQDKFDRSDLSKLTRHRDSIPGADEQTLLVGVSRSGFDLDGLDVRLTPGDLIAAFTA